MFDDDDREREKKSWREIDQLRDGGHHREPKTYREKKKAYDEQRELSEHKAALEKLFTDGPQDKEQARYLKAIREAKDKKALVSATASHEKKYGMPKDWDTLLRLLDHPEARVVIEVMELLRLRAPNRLPEEREYLKGHLKVLKMTTRDPDIEEKAEALAAGLG
jgi:hypothetical protein